jgi:hypothetical protein
MKIGIRSMLLQLSLLEAGLLDAERRAAGLQALMQQNLNTQPSQEHPIQAEMDKFWGHAAEAATAAAAAALAEQQGIVERLNQLLPWQAPADRNGYSYI